MTEETAPARAYRASRLGDRWHQGEILTNFVERSVRHLGLTASGDEFGFDEVVHPYVVIWTQDCDLETDWRVRSDASASEQRKANALLLHVQLVAATEYSLSRSRFPSSDVQKRAHQNKDERYHFLSAVAADDDCEGSGVPALLLDFKRLFSCPISSLTSAVDRKETGRRAFLDSPYVEHFSDRVAYFIQRIGLPLDHHDF